MSSSILWVFISDGFDSKSSEGLILFSKRLILGEEGRYMCVKSPVSTPI
jgi:hypothetical protein